MKMNVADHIERTDESLDSSCTAAIFSLHDLRAAKGYSQLQVAQLINISPGLYNSIEAGHRKPSADILFKLAELYGTSMDFVYRAFYRQFFIFEHAGRVLHAEKKISKKGKRMRYRLYRK